MSDFVKWLSDLKASNPQALGIYLGSRLKKDRMFSCLNGSAHKNGDRNPSAQYYPDTDTFFCHACRESGDIVDAVQFAEGISDRVEASNVVADMCRFPRFNEGRKSSSLKATGATRPAPVKQMPRPAPVERKPINWPDKVPCPEYFRKCQDNLTQTDYMQKRGISVETCRRFGVGYDSTWVSVNAPKQSTPTPRIIVPLSDSFAWTRKVNPEGFGMNQMETVRNAVYPDGTEFDAVVRSFNVDTINKTGDVFLVESITDALSFEEVGFRSMAVNGKGKGKKFVDTELCRLNPQCRFFIALDNDKDNPDTDKRQTELVKAIYDLGFPVVDCNRHSLFNGHKDANDALVADRGAFMASVKNVINTSMTEQDKEKQDYFNNSVLGQLERFKTWSMEKRPVFSTGIEALDDKLDGGFREGLALIGAVPSLGKTTLCQQLAYSFASQGYDVFFYALEMRDVDLMAKDLSRLTCINSINQTGNVLNALKANKISRQYESDTWPSRDIYALNKAMEQYEKVAGNLYYFSRDVKGEITVETIRQDMEKHRTITGRSPIVFVDYLQLLPPLIPNGTDKQNVDRNMMALIDLWKEFNVPVFCICSLNRDNYREPFNNSALKESGGAEFGADYIIGLQWKGLEYQEESVNDRRARLAREALDRQQHDREASVPRLLELKITKNRYGGFGILPLTFWHHFAFFEAGKETDDLPKSNSPVPAVPSKLSLKKTAEF